ncbi:uncharacterized protein LOC117345392 [Pecten maximus]|uniref:uncharacterized protein LOC117345392 n=1 Tax=Pecten maximus TaxID=6579 RepID=UPI001458090C|nr:uncharacterized protein LOC117345392 [Pecten maximus]
MPAHYKYVHFIWLTFMVLTGYIITTDSLVCYQCSDSSNGGTCRTNFEGMEKEFINRLYPSNSSHGSGTEDENSYTYTQPCDEKYCIFQDITQAGKTIGFIRGCSSGNDSLPNAGYTKRIDRIQANNKTVCGISMVGNGMKVCVTICQQDLCNGPQFEQPVNAGNMKFQELSFMLSTVLMVLFTYALPYENYV